ncbi:BppU family phage baseplate upper protein [Enterococcus durans]|uniref:BppU family phage baseplate upper protein n=1 Tax=Enterococcus durans TaxID=53345 RepID=UPI0039A77B2A
MTIRKVADIIIRASPNGRLNVTGSELKFYSYDKNSAAIDFYIQNQDRTPTDLFNVDVKLMLLTRENNEWKQFTSFDGVEIISRLDGHARYVIPDELRGYQGIVEGYVYLDFNDDSRSDECYFNFTIERSRIEEEFEHAGEYYIKEIQDTLDETIAELKKYAAEKINEYEAQLSSLNSKISNTTTLVDSLATQTTSIQAKQAEILKLIADNNVATKQDIELMIAANHVENLATQDEAESGTDNKKTMTPLRVFQAIAKWTKEKFVNKTGNETIAGAKNFTSTPLVNNVAVAKSDNVLNLIDPQTALGLKNFKNGIQLNGLNIASEYAKAVDTDKYNRKGAVYLGGNVWIAWETLTFQNTSGYSKGSYIRLGSDNNAAFTYPDVKNTTGGYIWLGGACQPDYTDGGFGSYHITIENNFDDARKPIVRFVDSPTTPVKKLAVRGVALIFAPPPTENSKI